MRLQQRMTTILRLFLCEASLVLWVGSALLPTLMSWGRRLLLGFRGQTASTRQSVLPAEAFRYCFTVQNSQHKQQILCIEINWKCAEELNFLKYKSIWGCEQTPVSASLLTHFPGWTKGSIYWHDGTLGFWVLPGTGLTQDILFYNNQSHFLGCKWTELI